MSDLIKLHDKTDGKDALIRISNIEAVYDISSNEGTQVVYRCGSTMEKMYVVEGASEILRIINIEEQYNEKTIVEKGRLYVVT